MVLDRWSRRAEKASDLRHTAGTELDGRSASAAGGTGAMSTGTAPPRPSESLDTATMGRTVQSAAGPGGANSILDAVIARVRDARNALGLTGEIVPFGSHVNGFSTATSDCDVSYMPPQGNKSETPIRILRRFANELPSHGFEGLITIFQATIPLVKAVGPSGIEMDLCVGNLLGHQNSKLMAAYCGLDARVGQVGRHVKQWAKACELIGSSDGLLNSYAYTLLTIFYLMHTRPPVVPNLQDLAKPPHGGCDPVTIRDRKWGREIAWDCCFWSDIHLIPRSQNTEGVESLLRGFFKFYTRTFDWAAHAVSIRTALIGGFTPKADLQGPVQREQWYVEDPFDLKHNLASQCTRDGRQRILDKMSDTLQELANMTDDVLSAFANHCMRGPTNFMLKCRVHMEKVTVTDFVNTFRTVREVEPFVVKFPVSQTGRGKEVMDAFLVFQREPDRRRMHRLNETFIGEWQLRLLPCSAWALDNAADSSGYEEVAVIPRALDGTTERANGEEASEEVRSGLRVAQTPQEVNALIERARAMSLPHEEMLGKKKLRELLSASQPAADDPVSEIRFQ